MVYNIEEERQKIFTGHMPCQEYVDDMLKIRSAEMQRVVVTAELDCIIESWVKYCINPFPLTKAGITAQLKKDHHVKTLLTYEELYHAVHSYPDRLNAAIDLMVSHGRLIELPHTGKIVKYVPCQAMLDEHEKIVMQAKNAVTNKVQGSKQKN